jgi:predicted ATP-grasp superfamily ATP-dependent carboligase
LRHKRSDPILIVGTWGRPLAQSAWRAGIEVVVLDLFADSDTRRYARAAHSIATTNTGHIDSVHAAALAQEFAANCNAIVYTAAFEHAPEQIEQIAAGRNILGNSAATIRAAKDPATLRALLQRIGMPHPETTLLRPAAGAGWLVKRAGEQGGAHVLPLDDLHQSRPGDYFQRKVDGVPHSALFIADGKRARIIGLSEQLTMAVGAAPYRYGGAVSNAPLPLTITADVATKLDELVRSTGLIGLNSIDFIVDGARYFVLEINPRPPATMDLYDEDCPGGLLAWHIAACEGNIVSTPLTARAIRGHAVVFAQQASRVPYDFSWPTWCSDVEAPGTLINATAPVCMVHATGDTPAETKSQLLARRESVLRAIAVD